MYYFGFFFPVLGGQKGFFWRGGSASGMLFAANKMQMLQGTDAGGAWGEMGLGRG